MKLIDGHVYIGNTIYVDQSPEHLVSEMDRLGVDISVVVASPPGPFYDEANRLVQTAARNNSGRMVALYRANPLLKGEAEKVSDALNNENFVGVQLDPSNDGYSINGSSANQVISIAKDHKVPVFIHSGDSIFCPPEYVADLALNFKDVNFVTSMSSRAPRAASSCSNLYLMLHPFPTLAFQRQRAAEFDLDRLIFVSESPIGNLEVQMKAVDLAGLDQETKGNLLGKNLQRILKT